MTRCLRCGDVVEFVGLDPGDLAVVVDVLPGGRYPYLVRFFSDFEEALANESELQVVASAEREP